MKITASGPNKLRLLGDVNIVTPAGGEVLEYDAGSGKWVNSSPAGTGDVTGPASATDGNVVLFNGATGKVIKDAGFSFNEGAQDAVGSVVGNGLDYDDTTGAISVDETELNIASLGGSLSHQVLSNLQGGTTNEYYHLTSAQNTLVSGITADAAELNILDGATLSTAELNYVDGVTSAIQTQLNAKQASDATLTALAAYNTNGILTQTAADTFVGRTITGTADQITVTNGDGVAGNPTLSLPADVIIPTVITAPNTGLHILDTNASHDLIIKPGSDLTADKTLTITTGDNDRTLNISAANVTITSYGASLVAAANDVAAQIVLGLTIGGTVQAYDATLAALAGQNWAANSLAVGSGADTVAQVTFAANTFPARASTGNLEAKPITDFGLDLIDSANAAAAVSTLGLDALYVNVGGDTMTGTLTIDIPADNSAIKIIQNATQTTHPIQVRNSADSAYTSAIDANGRFRMTASTSSGIAWYSGDLTTTNYGSFNHTSTAMTLTNLAGELQINGFATSSTIFNSGQLDINHIFRSDNEANLLNLDGGLDTIAIAGSPQTLKKLTINQSHNSTGNPTTLEVNATQTAAAATTLKAATFNVFMTHASGSLSGANITEYNFNASGNGGTTSTIEGLNFNGSVGTGHTVNTLNYIHLYNPTVNGTLTTFRALLVEAGNIIFNESGGAYSVRIETDNNDSGFAVDGTNDRVGVNIAAGSMLAKFHVAQTNTTAAIPVLYLNQADVSEQMIQFETTIGTGNAIEAVGAKVLTTTHFIKVTIPGGLTRYFPVGTIA